MCGTMKSDRLGNLTELMKKAKKGEALKCKSSKSYKMG